MKKERSPSYPSMNLNEAIEMFKVFHSKTKGYPVDASDEKPVAYKEIGYEKPHGDAKRALAALVAYGLVENIAGKSPRQVQSSDLGRKIATYPSDDPKRPQWLRDAALGPKVFASLLGKFPQGLPPSDSPVNSFLLDEGFTAAVTPEVIKDFKATAAFANLFEGVNAPDNSPNPEEMEAQKKKDEAERLEEARRRDAGQENKSTFTPAVSPTQAGMESLPILLGPGKQVILQYPSGLTKQDIEDFDEVWAIYKKRLIRQQENRSPVPEAYRAGAATWRNATHDDPVTVTSYAGTQNGRHYVNIEGSTTGIPLDELVYGSEL